MVTSLLGGRACGLSDKPVAPLATLAALRAPPHNLVYSIRSAVGRQVVRPVLAVQWSDFLPRLRRVGTTASLCQSQPRRDAPEPDRGGALARVARAPAVRSRWRGSLVTASWTTG